eukprot:13752841-Alexandrium_andersonii.AAC.1
METLRSNRTQRPALLPWSSCSGCRGRSVRGAFPSVVEYAHGREKVGRSLRHTVRKLGHSFSSGEANVASMQDEAVSRST